MKRSEHLEHLLARWPIPLFHILIQTVHSSWVVHWNSGSSHIFNYFSVALGILRISPGEGREFVHFTRYWQFECRTYKINHIASSITNHKSSSSSLSLNFRSSQTLSWIHFYVRSLWGFVQDWRTNKRSCSDLAASSADEAPPPFPMNRAVEQFVQRNCRPGGERASERETREWNQRGRQAVVQYTAVLILIALLLPLCLPQDDDDERVPFVCALRGQGVKIHVSRLDSAPFLLRSFATDAKVNSLSDSRPVIWFVSSREERVLIRTAMELWWRWVEGGSCD